MFKIIRRILKFNKKICGIVALFIFAFYTTINSVLWTHHANISVKIKTNFDKNLQTEIDWHDYQYILGEQNRTGLGENGVAAYLPIEQKINEKNTFKVHSFNMLLSDEISLNRSVNDIRHKDCLFKKYLSHLPSVSIIIIFNNEHLRTLLRTCYSILNRTPSKLVNEVILVDDGSDFSDLGKPLDDFLKTNLPKVKIIRLAKRSGLIRARLAGAKLAKSDVLVFLDAHCEANTNWLPPLLDPIARNYKRVMCPFIDVIDVNTFAYSAQDDGGRGAFDWNFEYKRLKRLPEDSTDPSAPFKSPIMAGGLFAISTKFFWELGGYDDGLNIWGGEQYELSFKIWMCGGELYDAPCSRVGHIYREHNPRPDDDDEYLYINFKRVAEVWMDEYKQFLYKKEPELYAMADAGDLTEQKALREKLKCKPFKWFLKEIAFDLMEMYPPEEPPNEAWGAIQSYDVRYCAAKIEQNLDQPIGLSQCMGNVENPILNQFFVYTWRQEIRLHQTELCLDVSETKKDAPVALFICHHFQGNQLWKYDPKKQWIIHVVSKRCLEFNTTTSKIVVNTCQMFNRNMLWRFGKIQMSAINQFNQ